MDNEILAISDISRSVCYEDPLMLSKMFKKIKGTSPSYYRKSLILKTKVKPYSN